MKWEIVDKALSFQGYFRLLTYRLSHALYAGGMSPVITRELLVRGQAAAVLPYDPVREEVVLIEQFRVGALESPRGPWLVEIPAGLIEPGEGPEDVARREAMEEAGCALGELVLAHHCYSSPGSCDERVAIYIGRTSTQGLGGVYGVREEGEDIRVRVVSTEEAFAMMRNGIVDSAMPLLALQWLALNHESLREDWS